MQVLKGNNSHTTFKKSSKLQPPFNKNLAPQLPRLNGQAFLVTKGHQLISAHRLQLLWLKPGRDRSSHRSQYFFWEIMDVHHPLTFLLNQLVTMDVRLFFSTLWLPIVDDHPWSPALKARALIRLWFRRPELLVNALSQSPHKESFEKNDTH